MLVHTTFLKDYSISTLERNLILRRVGIRTASPVRGFRPILSAETEVEKTPKPEITTLSPAMSCWVVSSKAESTTLFTTDFDKFVFSATALINCDLFILNNGN